MSYDDAWWWQQHLTSPDKVGWRGVEVERLLALADHVERQPHIREPARDAQRPALSWPLRVRGFNAWPAVTGGAGGVAAYAFMLWPPVGVPEEFVYEEVERHARQSLGFVGPKGGGWWCHLSMPDVVADLSTVTPSQAAWVLRRVAHRQHPIRAWAAEVYDDQRYFARPSDRPEPQRWRSG